MWGRLKWVPRQAGRERKKRGRVSKFEKKITSRMRPLGERESDRGKRKLEEKVQSGFD